MNKRNQILAYSLGIVFLLISTYFFTHYGHELWPHSCGLTHEQHLAATFMQVEGHTCGKTVQEGGGASQFRGIGLFVLWLGVNILTALALVAAAGADKK